MAVTAGLGRRSPGKVAGAGERLLGIIPGDWRWELTRLRVVRWAVRERWVTFGAQLFNLAIFVLILVAGLWGTPVGNRNLAILFVWILWWSVLMLVLLPLAGRIWCWMCPLPVLAEWLQRRLRFVTAGAQLLGLQKRWPRRLSNMWLVNGTFLLVAVLSGIITTRPLATAALLLAIIGASVAVSLVYQRRTFCRYLCPVGGFLGLYSNFAPLEVRSRNFTGVCQPHTPKECVVGSAQGYGCPWLEAPMTMERNTYCGLCFECFRACSKNNMALRLRPFGVDLLVTSRRGLDEAWKGFIMLGAAGVYAITYMGPYGWLKDWANLESPVGFAGYALGFAAFVAVAIPLVHGLFVWLGSAAAVRLPALSVAEAAGVRATEARSGSAAPPDGPGRAAATGRAASGQTAAGSGAASETTLRQAFLHYAYTLVPLGLAAWIAFSFAILLPNGSYLVSVVSDPFGWGWDLFGTAGAPWKPVWTGWLPYLQIPVILMGLGFGLDLAWKTARRLYADTRQAAWSATPVMVWLTAVAVGLLWAFTG